MHQALVSDNSCNPSLESRFSAERLEVSEGRKISRLNSVQRVFARTQYPARYGDGTRILAAKQFGHRVSISVSSVADQFRF
jgi:hypothetical protein